MPEADCHRADQTIAQWRLAAENHDAASAIACLAEDVVLISPTVTEGLLKDVEIAEAKYKGLVIWSPD